METGEHDRNVRQSRRGEQREDQPSATLRGFRIERVDHVEVFVEDPDGNPLEIATWVEPGEG